jgi:hypothetical protein
MNRHLYPLVVLLSLGFSTLSSQSQLTEHTLALDNLHNAAKATIEDFAWLIGRWEGEGFGGVVEESWNPALGGTMTGTFRLVTDDGPEFYEMLLLAPDSNNHIVYKVKHFHPDFTGWEEKDDYISFPLVRITHDALYFHGLTLQRDGDKCIHYLAMGRNDGSHKEVKLEYIRRERPVAEEIKELLTAVPVVNDVSLLILGSYHMSNPGQDMFNFKADDVLAPKRQEELQAVVDRLALWRPTKVAIEAPFGDSLVVSQYQAYLRGEFPLGKSEEQQIGFRLAKQLGHETIYPIDVRMGLNNSALNSVIESDPMKYGPYMQDLQTIGELAMSNMSKWLSEGTIGAMLYKMNDPEIMDVSHSVYFRGFAPLVSGDNYAGVDFLNTWYHRNLRIFGNLHQISDRPDDRIFIIYGQGHVPLLQKFAEDSPYFRVDDVQEYLRGL